jgi:predicted ester cyclase
MAQRYPSTAIQDTAAGPHSETAEAEETQRVRVRQPAIADVRPRDTWTLVSDAAIVVLRTTASIPDVMHSIENLVRTFYDQLWNQWDDEAVDDVLHADFEFRGSLGDVTTGRNAWRTYRDTVREAVPDFHNEIITIVVAPGSAAARLEYSGHHHGLLLGVRGRGREICYSGAAFFRGDGMVLTEAWVLGDLDALRRQVEAD